MILLYTTLLNMFTNRFPQREPQNSVSVNYSPFGSQIHFPLCSALLGTRELGKRSSLMSSIPQAASPSDFNCFWPSGLRKQRRERRGYSPQLPALVCVSASGYIRLQGEFLSDGPSLLLLQLAVGSFNTVSFTSALG